MYILSYRDTDAACSRKEAVKYKKARVQNALGNQRLNTNPNQIFFLLAENITVLPINIKIKGACSVNWPQGEYWDKGGCVLYASIYFPLSPF